MIRSASSRLPSVGPERAGLAAVVGHADRLALLLGDEEADLAAAGVRLVDVDEVGVGDRGGQLPGDDVERDSMAAVRP